MLRTTNAYNFGKTVATRYASDPNIVWHVIGDFRWSYNQAPARVSMPFTMALEGIQKGLPIG